MKRDLHVGDVVVREPDGRGSGATAWAVGSFGVVTHVGGDGMHVRPDAPDWTPPSEVSIFRRGGGWRHATPEELTRRDTIAEAKALLRTASEAVAKAREAVVEAADLWECGQGYRVGLLEEAVRAHRVAVGDEVIARARLEALR